MIRKRFDAYPDAFVFRPLQVVRSQHVTPQLVRVTLGGESIGEISSLAPDDDVRVQIPERFDDTPLPPTVELQPYKLVYPENAPPTVLRALTIRAFRPEHLELDIEIALHGEGILSRWAEQARPGQRVTMGGPYGAMLWEGGDDHYYLIGDATALPAIARFVESLPPEAVATAVIEVADAGEEQVWGQPERGSLTTIWLHRDGRRPGRTSLLEDAIEDLPIPTESTVIFAAGESAQCDV